MLQITATLIERRTLGSSQELRLQAPVLARMLAPGQAVLVKTGWGVEPYLRRTFYPVGLDDEGWTLRVPPGGDWGHAWLRAAPVGTQLDCLGPVGIGYSLPAGIRNLLCLGEGDVAPMVGGGCSAWALLPAIAQADRSGLAVTFAMEAPTGRDLIPAQRLPAAVEYHTPSVPGSRFSGRAAPLSPKGWLSSCPSCSRGPMPCWQPVRWRSTAGWPRPGGPRATSWHAALPRFSTLPPSCAVSARARRASPIWPRAGAASASAAPCSTCWTWQGECGLQIAD